MHNGQTIGINRPFRAFWHEIIHHAQKARRQEEPDRIVAVPPLDHGALDAGSNGIAFIVTDIDRQADIIAQMQHGNGNNKSQIEPVRNI